MDRWVARPREKGSQMPCRVRATVTVESWRVYEKLNIEWCPKYMGSEISDDYAYLLGALRDACVYLPEYELKFVQKNLSWLSDVVQPKLMRTFDIGRMGVHHCSLFPMCSVAWGL